MCGINGFNFKNKDLIIKMNQATKHRGPDGLGFYVDDFVSIGHNLLAITETPENSRQPVISEDKNFVLSYNGEIYNYKLLRNDLEKCGDIFTTNSDMEVLFRGLMRYNSDFLDKLDGMFAFAFYDKRRQKLYLARDPAGMKPLYFYFQNGRLIFSSEIKGILTQADAKLNYKAAQVFFLLGYVPGPDTLFNNIHKVMPGQYLVFDLRNKELKKQWFGFKDRYKKNVEFQGADLRELIGKSVEAHTMGLRPFGLYLSGGLDSTVILHELAQNCEGLIKTYTTRFDIDDPEINQDAEMAKRLCNDYDIEHHELLITEKDFIEAHEETIETLEEPRYHISMPAYWLLARFASKDIVVVLSGNGGDELFLGYDRYLESAKISRQYQKLGGLPSDLWHTVSGLKRNRIKFGHWQRLSNLVNKWTYLNKINYRVTEPSFKFADFDIVDLACYLASIDAPPITNPLSDSENAIAELDRLFWLADEEFIRTDKIAMRFGMEGRFPFLAKDIIRYANSISSNRKLKGGATKALIREAYYGYLPDYIINKSKTGWYAPTVRWMNSNFGKKVRETLSNNFYNPTAELFDLDFVRKNYFDSVTQFTRGNIKRFMPIFAFQIWASKFKVEL